MPSWKKVITSGSNAALNSLTVSNGITSSLFGTASWALNALTSSYSLNPTVSGAINNVNYIDFNESAGVTVQSGQLAWNSTDGTLDLGLKGGNVTLQIGQETLYEVRNATGVTISNGTSLYASGVTAGSGRIEASPFTADGSIREVRFLGLATEDIGNGVNGFVTHFGYTRGLDTRGTAVTAISVGDEDWSVGDILYAHPTAAGKLTNVKPKHEISVAIVIIRHQSTGVLFVRPSSFGHLEDNHDVNINTGSLATGDLLIYDSGSDYWINSKQLSGSYGLTGSLNATSFVGPLTGNATTATTASHALTASSINPLYQDVELHGNLVVYGTSSFTYVTSSQLAVDDSYISVNVFEPAERFAGLKVYDSGSASHQATASLSWDSTRNHWVYSNASGSTYTGGMFMSGPRNTGSLGDEPTLTKWMVARSDGGDHLENTQIYSSASITQVTGSLTVTQGVTGSLQGTASFATQTLSASFTVSSSRAVTASMAILAPSYLPLAGGTMTGDIYAAGRTFQFQDLVLGVGTTFGTIKTDGGKYIGVYPTNGVESTRFLANGHVLFQNGGTYTDKGYRLQISASNSISGALQVTGNSVMTGSLIVSQGITGSLFGTSSWAQNAVTASFLDSTTNAFVQNGNSFGALALLGTNDNNSLALETSGSTRMFISSSGLVGIGTTSPTFNLQVVGTSYASSYMQTPIVYADSFQPFAASQDFVGKLRNSAYKFDFQKADGTSLVVISGSGNVGIGITAPTTPLHVSGTIHVQTGNGSTFYGQDSGGSYARTFGVEVYDFRDAAGATKVRINTSTGNVGIGTTSPIEKLHIVSTSGSAATYPIAIQNATSSIDAKVGIKFIAAGATTRYAAIEGIQEDGNNSIALGFITGQGATITEKMRIVPGGNVGIGTAAPLYKLDVVGNIRAYTSIIRRDTSAGSAFINYNESASGYWSVGMPVSSYSYIITDSNYGIDKLAITNGSTWGIGIGKTAPNARLDVSGSAIISGSFTVTPGTVREFQVNTTGIDIGNLSTDTHTVTGSLSVSGSVIATSLTGSLFGTASFATSASFASTASFLGSTTNAFLQNGNSFGTTALLGTNDNQSLALETSGSTRMFISSSGLVGIGTTSPNALLNIVTSTSGEAFIFKGSNGKEFVSINHLGYLRSRASDTNGANMHFIDNGGTKRMEMGVSTTAMNWYSDSLASQFFTLQHSTGNVGIGATNPSAKLEVIGDLRVYKDGADTLTSSGVYIANGANSRAYNLQQSSTGDSLNLWAYGGSSWANRVTFKADGNVGIGTNTPNAKLDVNGDAIITGSLVVTGRITAEEFHTEFVSSSIIFQSGSTKFGDTSDDVHQFTGSLRVNGSITGSLFGTSSWAQNAVTASYTNVGSLGGFVQGGNSFGATALLGTNDNQSLALETNGSTKMFISSSGAVGIGTTSPVQSLHVVGSINIPTNSKLFWNNGNASIHETGNSLLFSTWTGAALTEKMSILGNGNVGIGTTSPTYKLHVSSSNNNDGIAIHYAANNSAQFPFIVSSNADSAGSYVRINTDIIELRRNGGASTVKTVGSSNNLTLESAANLVLNTNGATEAMRITATGNVGIGTTSPNAKLDVNGNTIITGSLAVSQSLLQYSNVTAVTSGSTSNVASFSTGSYTAAFFDYVTTSGTNARAGSVFTVWNGNSVEYTETSTNDIGSTSNLILSASVTAGAVRLQATSLSGSWSVKTLARML